MLHNKLHRHWLSPKHPSPTRWRGPWPVMSRVLLLALILGTGLVASGRGLAAEESKTEKKSGGGQFGKILWFGLDGGPFLADSLNEKQEISKTGYSFGLKSNFSYITEIANFEIGAEWLHTFLEVPDDSKDPVMVDDPASAEVPVGVTTTQVKTRLGGANFSIRFGLVDNVFEIGPTAHMFFGTDTSFNPMPGEQTKNPNVMLGVNAAINIKMPSEGSLAAFRLFAQYLHDVTIDDRQVQLINVGFDVGFGFAKEKPKVIVKEKIRTVTKTKTKVVVKTKVERDVKVVNKESYLVDAGVVNFETARHDIYPNVQAYLRDLAMFLRSRQPDWDEMILKSHTDYRGGATYNEGLSRRRANAVQSILIANGIAGNRLRVESNSYRKPVDRNTGSVSLAKNRRVELFVRGGQNTPALKQEIFRLQQLHRLPSTCSGSNCQ